MPNQLPIPPELQHLIEKREGEDRRKGDRRGNSDQTEKAHGLQPVCLETADSAGLIEERDENSPRDQHSRSKRRQHKDRREEARREDD